jgi:hypothetical protein
VQGADCLGKYVGDAERQLRLLFQAAAAAGPSIIFFDELDGLAPARQGPAADQTYASVVATLLALLDGTSPRGAVVVIGATNRPDAIDPALRRPVSRPRAGAGQTAWQERRGRGQSLDALCPIHAPSSYTGSPPGKAATECIPLQRWCWVFPSDQIWSPSRPA